MHKSDDSSPDMGIFSGAGWILDYFATHKVDRWGHEKTNASVFIQILSWGGTTKQKKITIGEFSQN